MKQRGSVERAVSAEIESKANGSGDSLGGSKGNSSKEGRLSEVREQFRGEQDSRH